MTGQSSAPIVLVHGAWHGSWCWSAVTPLLAAAGRAAAAVDMEAHGMHAILPASAPARPFDAAAFATERSPHADVTLTSAARLLVSQIEAVGRPVVLVAHSMAGHVVSAAAQLAPALVERLVYVTGFMAPSDADAGAYIQSPENAGELIGPLVVADPGVVGAIRMDVRSPDPAYRAGLREALFGDVPEAIADAAIRQLSCDCPLGIPAGTTELTREAWGGIPRTYVRCSADRAILPALQDRFIAEADAAFPQNPTRTVGLDTSHSPFLSQPDRVAAAILTA
jgi:pimeloyl-ACP methyl ester carboxylesterase